MNGYSKRFKQKTLRKKVDFRFPKIKSPNKMTPVITSYIVNIPFRSFKFFFCDGTRRNHNDYIQYLTNDGSNCIDDDKTIQLCFAYDNYGQPSKDGKMKLHWFVTKALQKKFHSTTYALTSGFGSWWHSLTDDLEAF